MGQAFKFFILSFYFFAIFQLVFNLFLFKYSIICNGIVVNLEERDT